MFWNFTYLVVLWQFTPPPFFTGSKQPYASFLEVRFFPPNLEDRCLPKLCSKKTVLLLFIFIRIDPLIGWLQWNDYRFVPYCMDCEFWTFDSVNISKNALHTSSGCFRKGSRETLKVVGISIKKTRRFLKKIEIQKKIVSTHLQCFNVLVAKPLRYLMNRENS